MDEVKIERTTALAGEEPALSIREQVAAWFLRYHQGRLTAEDFEALQAWLLANPDHAAAWRETQKIWNGFSEHAMLPELVAARREALSAVRRVQLKRWTTRSWSARRWVLAAAVSLVALGAVWWRVVLDGNTYSTDIGEQRTVLLTDNSRMTLDALTRVRVLYDKHVRSVELLQGQAQFEVAHQSGRPFRVRAGDRVIEAHGTVFAVEYVDQRMRVALLEGSVTVTPVPDSDPRLSRARTPSVARPVGPAPQNAADRTAIIELKPGEALRIEADGEQALDAQADLAAATAWRQGKVIFRQEPLRDAVSRLNRYSRVQIEIVDPAIEQWPVSGIFGSGDAEAFAEAISVYFPIQVQRSDPDVIELRKRP